MATRRTHAAKRERLAHLFQAAHELGAKEFGATWLTVHNNIVQRLTKDFTLSDPALKAAIAVATLSALRTFNYAQKQQ